MITYRMLEQYDDAGALYDAFTLEAYDDADDVTTWYENIVVGWTFETPRVHSSHIFTVCDVPEGMSADTLEALEDSERLELHDRAYTLTNRPGVTEEAAAAAGLQYLGTFETRHSGRPGVDPADEWAAALARHLDAIGYDDVTSF